MSADLTAEDVARRTSVALVVVQDGAARWLNAAAVRLVEPHGGSWTGQPSVLTLLRDVRAGTRRETLRWPSPVGGTRWWQITCRFLEATEPALLYEITDETSRHHLDEDARNDRWRLSRLEALAGMGSWEWFPLEDRIEWSDALLKLFGLPPGTLLRYADYRAMLHADDTAMIDRTLAEALRTAQPFTYTHRIHPTDGSTPRTLECYGEVFTDASGAPVRLMGTARDVTEQRRARAELAFLADHDPLTGVANRRRVTTWLAEHVRQPDGAALLLIDVDNFKDVNDVRGHVAGDRVLRELAGRLGASIGADDLLGRLGGDEFAVLVPAADTGRGLELAQRLCHVVAGISVPDAAGPLQVTVSIGVAVLPRGAAVETGLAQADLALYEAKGAGRNCARLFADDQYDQAARRVSVLQRVRNGLDTGTMSLDAQPIVDLATGQVGRYELLIRLRDGLEPVLGPAEFLPTAERTDLVLRLDRWVVDRAVAALARSTGLRLEVNVSARSLADPTLGDWILDALRRADVAPHRLGLEITETAAITRLDAAGSLATRLTEAGCGFALDDFGAGFGSFSYLKHLPFTGIKIAGEFVRHLDTDRVDRALVGAVVGVAHQLGMTTVAEQVDRGRLVELLRGLGVDDGQGFWFARPRPLEAILGDR